MADDDIPVGCLVYRFSLLIFFIQVQIIQPIEDKS